MFHFLLFSYLSSFLFIFCSLFLCFPCPFLSSFFHFIFAVTFCPPCSKELNQSTLNFKIVQCCKSTYIFQIHFFNFVLKREDFLCEICKYMRIKVTRTIFHKSFYYWGWYISCHPLFLKKTFGHKYVLATMNLQRTVSFPFLLEDCNEKKCIVIEGSFRVSFQVFYAGLWYCSLSFTIEQMGWK